VQKIAVVETYQPAAAIAAASQNPPSKDLLSILPLIFLSGYFTSSGKQGGGATVLREGCDIVTRETCGGAKLSL
jgi:hypothetical protein